MRRPWSRESRPVARWGFLRVVWPLLAMMTWLCKHGRRNLQEALKLTNEPDTKLKCNLETHASLQTKIKQLTAACFLQQRSCSLLLGFSWTLSRSTRQSGSPACGCWDMTLMRRALEGCTTPMWLP